MKDQVGPRVKHRGSVRSAACADACADPQGRGASTTCASTATPRRRTSSGVKASALASVAAAASVAAVVPSASASEAWRVPTEARAGVVTINRSGLGTFAYTAPSHAPCKRGRRKHRRRSSSGGDSGGDGSDGGGDGGNGGNNWGDWSDGNDFNGRENVSVLLDALSLLALSGSLHHLLVRGATPSVRRLLLPCNLTCSSHRSWDGPIGLPGSACADTSKSFCNCLPFRRKLSRATGSRRTRRSLRAYPWPTVRVWLAFA